MCVCASRRSWHACLERARLQLVAICSRSIILVLKSRSPNGLPAFRPSRGLTCCNSLAWVHAPQCLYAVRCKARTESLRHASCAWEPPTDLRIRVVCKTRLHFDCICAALCEIIRMQAVIPVHDGCRYPLNYSGAATFNSGAWKGNTVSSLRFYTSMLIWNVVAEVRFTSDCESGPAM